MSVTVTDDEWNQLVGLAQQSLSGESLRELASQLIEIERRNEIRRYQLLVRWTEVGVPLPASTTFPTTWPASYQAVLRKINVPITRAEVEQCVSDRARHAVGAVLVTDDPAGIIGWSDLDTYF